MSKQEFFIEQLKPYFLDPTICGYDFGMKACLYKTSDGKKCVFGKNLTEEFINSDFSQSINADDLLSKLGDKILIEESRDKLTSSEWVRLQQIHDRLAYYTEESSIDNRIILLDKIASLENLFSTDLSELRNLVK